MTKIKSNPAIFSIVIVLVSTFPYIHDLIPYGYGEVLGFSDWQVFLYMILNHVFALVGWVLAYYLAKGRQWRFVLWLPIMSTTYEIFLKILNLRSTSLNEINIKFTLTFILFALLVIWYFKKKSYQ